MTKVLISKVEDNIVWICNHDFMIYTEQGVPKEELLKSIHLILNEIGFKKTLSVIRWLAYFLTKICLNIYTGIYINEKSIMEVKQKMGKTPIIFMPSHKSYGDFILMSYICFTYDIEIPAIAAAMDFHGMMGMGSVLRNTGAFFIRRSFINDALYKNVFEQYVNQIVTKGDLPLEFFIEGTRSRSCKSLSPKYGLLNMVLKPFFTSEISDILIIPINISYDRMLEERLFAFELLGIPKPKESTSGLLKALSIVKEQFGKIFVDFGEPISVKKYFENVDRSVHNIKPMHLQESTQQEKQQTIVLANEVVHIQQKLCTVTTSNLMAVSIMNNAILNKIQKLDDLIQDVIWLNSVLKSLGARIDIVDPEQNVKEALNIHKGLIQVNDNQVVNLVQNAISLDRIRTANLKGHSLSEKIMTFVVPYVNLQLYINPILHFLTGPATVVVILKHHEGINKDVLEKHYRFLVNMFERDFVTVSLETCSENLNHLINFKLIEYDDETYFLSRGNNLMEVFYNIYQPFIINYYFLCKTIKEHEGVFNEKIIMSATQARLELFINSYNSFIHPYCLNLDSMTNCLGTLTMLGALKKINEDGKMVFKASITEMDDVIKQLASYIDVEIIKGELNLKSKL